MSHMRKSTTYKIVLILSGLLFISALSVIVYVYDNPLAEVFVTMLIGIPAVVIWLFLVIASIFLLIRYSEYSIIRRSLVLIVNLLTLTVVLVYIEISSAQYLSDSDIVVHERLFSPDKRRVILKYVYDIGALGYTRMITALAAVEDTSKNLSRFTLPHEYKKATWISSDSIAVEVDIRAYLARGEEFEQRVKEINGINIVVHTKGFDTNGSLFVEHRALSPDSTKELVAYRYRDDMEKGHLHISIIDEGDELPQLGNLYIGNQSEDFVFFGEWLSSHRIALFTTNTSSAQRYLLNKRSDILVELFEREYPITGIMPGWYHKKRCSPEGYLENELRLHGRPSAATVSSKFYFADGYKAGMMDILYNYFHEEKSYSGVFRAPVTTFANSIQIGDTIKIIYSTNKPDMHKIIRFP